MLVKSKTFVKTKVEKNLCLPFIPFLSPAIFTPQRSLLSPFSQISLKCMDRARPWTRWRSSCIKTRTSRSISPCAPALPLCKDRQRFRMKRELNVFPCYSASYFYCYWKCTNCFLFLSLSLIRGEGYFHLIYYTLLIYVDFQIPWSFMRSPKLHVTYNNFH